jgi:hypothetical protein
MKILKILLLFHVISLTSNSRIIPGTRQQYIRQETKAGYHQKIRMNHSPNSSLCVLRAIRGGSDRSSRGESHTLYSFLCFLFIYSLANCTRRSRLSSSPVWLKYLTADVWEMLMSRTQKRPYWVNRRFIYIIRLQLTVTHSASAAAVIAENKRVAFAPPPPPP